VMVSERCEGTLSQLHALEEAAVVTVLLPCCCSVVTVVLQSCYSGVAVLLQWCCSVVTVPSANSTLWNKRRLSLMKVRTEPCVRG
jgi:hypothetical protein